MHAYYAYLCLKPDEADLFCGFFPTYLALLADGYRASIPGVCKQQHFVSRCVVEVFASQSGLALQLGSLAAALFQIS